MAAAQLAAGLYGAIVVEDPGAVPVTRERVLVVSDLTLDASGHPAWATLPERMMGREGRIVLVNGQIRPQVSAVPGERERWRVVNACPARFLRLRLDGQTVRLLGRDGGRLRVPQDITEADLAPGNRVDLTVEAREGSSVLATDPVDRGGMDGMMGGRMGDGPFGTTETIDLLSLAVHGPPAQPLGPFPEAARLRDLRNEPFAARRTLDFDMGMGGMMMGGGGMGSFTINGKEFDPGRVDETVRSGTVEEWTLANSSPMDHPMHLHVWPMQIVEDGGRNLSEPTWQDVVTIPAGGKVKVLIAFDDFSGRTVFHCHILDHEDLGMMGTIEAR
jgi:FtsP/CotA-like multicopper oxidase with cupredoxin domain